MREEGESRGRLLDVRQEPWQGRGGRLLSQGWWQERLKEARSCV